MQTLRDLWNKVKNQPDADWAVCFENYRDDYRTFDAACLVIGKLITRNVDAVAINAVKELKNEIFESMEKCRKDWLEEMNKLVNLREVVISIQGYKDFDILEWDYCDHTREFCVQYKPKEVAVSCWKAALRDVLVKESNELGELLELLEELSNAKIDKFLRRQKEQK